MSQKRRQPSRSNVLDQLVENMGDDANNSFKTADEFPETLSLDSPPAASRPARYEEDADSEPSGRSFRYKSPARDDDVFRSYSVSLPDRQYDQIKKIRYAEMARLDRNISIAQVIRELIDVGIENTRGTKLFTKDRLRR